MNTTIQQLQPCYDFTVSIPKVDIKRFKGIIKAMGWNFEAVESMDETEYIKSNPKIMESISRGDEQIASGSFDTTKLEDLWN